MHQVEFVTGWAVLWSALQTRGVQIINCKNKFFLYEDAPEPLTCRNISKNGSNSWKLHEDNKFVGQCTADGNCTENSITKARISRERHSEESQLEFLGNLRQYAGYHISCNDDTTGRSDNCLLVVRHRPVLSNCRITSAKGDVTGSCSVDQMFASDGLYTCDWQGKNKMGKSVGKGNGTWGKSLFCSKTDRPEEYCKGTCSFTAPLPKDRGIYNYTIMVLGHPNGVFSNGILAEPGGNADMTETPPDEKPADEMDGDGSKKYIIVGVSISLLICAVAVTVTFSRRSLRRQSSDRNNRWSREQKEDDIEDHVNAVYQGAASVMPQHQEATGASSEQNIKKGNISIHEDDEHHYYSICD